VVESRGPLGDAPGSCNLGLDLQNHYASVEGRVVGEHPRARCHTGEANPTDAHHGESIMLTLYRPFTNLFRDDFFNDRDGSLWASQRRASETFSPAVDIVESDSAYLVKAEVPGLSPENIDVQVENDVLTVRGERKSENEEQRGGYRRVERRYGSFARSFVLPKGTNPDAIDAQVEHGVLTVTIPKVAAATARRVEVKGGALGLVEKAKKIFSKSPDAEAAAPPA
jgi:HSP20 family protein